MSTKNVFGMVLFALVGMLAGTSMNALAADGYSMQITFTNVPGGAILTNFPALVKLNTGNTDNYTGFLDTTSGWDLRFWTNSTLTGTELNYEIEAFNTNGTSFIWVQVPALTHNSSIWASWGHERYNSQEAYTTNGAVWSEGYVAVYHLAETSGPVKDSTANANDSFTITSGVTQDSSGQVNGAAAIDGTADERIEIADSTSLDGMTELTLEAWVYDTGNDAQPRAIVSKRNDSGGDICYSLFIHTSRLMYFDVGTDRDNGTTVLTANQWTHLAATFDPDRASEKAFFFNGSPDGTAADTNSGVVNKSTDFHLGILDATYTYSWKGTLDEIRISNVARSSNWVWACWMNQGANHDTFVEYGAPVPVAAGSITWSATQTTNVLATAAWATATVNTNLTDCVLVWHASNQGTVSTNDWPNRLSLGTQSEGEVTGQITGLSAGNPYVWRLYGGV